MPFDAQEFLAATASAPMSTTITPCPEGTFTAVVDDGGDLADWFREATWNDKQGNQRSAPTARIPMRITDQGVLDQLKRDSVIVPYDIFLDMTAAGKLDTSQDKNVKLGQLRDALGQNHGGQWSFAMLRGAGPLMVKVSQRSDKKDPSIKYAQVDRVAKVT